MKAAVALFFLLLPGPARAGGCLGRLYEAFRSGDPGPALGCFSNDAVWLDEEGVSAGTAAVRAGLGRLARQPPPAGWTLDWTRLSTGTWLASGLDGGRVLVVLDMAGDGAFWSAARVYRGARPWAGEVPSDKALTAEQAAGGFNRTFGAGDVEGWARFWAPDAVFVSVIGPFTGPEVPDFFRRQAERYIPPRMSPERDHGPDAAGALVMEGTLSGRCRDGGSPFAFPFLMRLAWRGERLSHVYEAFASLDDGCGPFWATPR